MHEGTHERGMQKAISMRYWAISNIIAMWGQIFSKINKLPYKICIKFEHFWKISSHIAIIISYIASYNQAFQKL
jgi:hypothetical protein